MPLTSKDSKTEAVSYTLLFYCVLQLPKSFLYPKRIGIRLGADGLQWAETQLRLTDENEASQQSRTTENCTTLEDA